RILLGDDDSYVSVGIGKRRHMGKACCSGDKVELLVPTSIVELYIPVATGRDGEREHHHFSRLEHDICIAVERVANPDTNGSGQRECVERLLVATFGLVSVPVEHGTLDLAGRLVKDRSNTVSSYRWTRNSHGVEPFDNEGGGFDRLPVEVVVTNLHK